MEISKNSKHPLFSQPEELLIGSWLYSIQHLPCSVSPRCMLGGSVEEVSTEDTLHWFIESDTHFGMAIGAEMNLTLNEPK